ncbi:MAG TPA: efflux transporter outer membrane subunit [Phenylobacterium sp.]|jgi:NodT family efflux transporter outer membrane factor (OMF) lipoprotein|uniref:efflux transporter outer membrane subunit n=1 Tax=Phenylobacterium sp. TaxID=1871053 RepID=UPI002B670F9B|nr:efflux transporter outer membrane subunit [Phenylobacterium sp.]HXA37620.1 efflux transporter outer membrane subunit [Phenylobacterium sp.]
MPSSTKPLTLLAVSASALALAACTTVGPNFKAPAGPSGPAASGYAMAGDAAPSGVRLSPDARVAGPWWQAFGSPELDAAIRQGLAGSPTVAEARANLEKAQAQAAAVRGAQLPQVDANASAQRERINLAAFGFSGFPGQPAIHSPTINLYQVGGSVSYDLDVFGGRKRATEKAVAQAEAAARQADAAYLSLSGNMAMQAMKIASLRGQMAATKEIIADDQRVIDMVRKAEAAGGEAHAALSSGVAQLAEDQALLPPLQRDLDAARHQMALLAGKSPAEWTAPDFDFARITAPGEAPVSLPSQLVRNRPDILQAEADLHAATAAVGVAVANQYPDIRLSAMLTQEAIKPGNLFRADAAAWDILGGVTAPIFHGGTLKAERKAAEADARVALARYEQTVLKAFVEVSDVLSNLGSDQQAIASLELANQAAESAARDAQSALRLGGGPMVDVVQAQRTLSRARRALVEAQGRRYGDLVQLYAATAADWRAADTAAAPPAKGG